MPHHSRIDIERWLAEFPLESFEEKSGPRRFESSDKDDPVDLWKASGSPISSPADLCKVELVRQRVAAKHSLSEPVPVDLFLWQRTPSAFPYLTKLGGTPFRDRRSKWPIDDEGKPYTFVAQFCFLDSLDVLPVKPPGDVLLVFFRCPDAYCGEESDIVLEWVNVDEVEPVDESDCPVPGFVVPSLYGAVHRFTEFDEWADVEAFKREGHYFPYHFGVTQSTKIGTVTHYIQGDPRISIDLEGVDIEMLAKSAGDTPIDVSQFDPQVVLDATLICTLNSIQLSDRWPLVDVEDVSNLETSAGSEQEYGWGPYEMMFADVGCIYFFLDENGRTHWRSDSY